MKQQKLKHCSFLLYNLYMENKILQQNNYNALQLSLTIDLGVKLMKMTYLFLSQGYYKE